MIKEFKRLGGPGFVRAAELGTSAFQLCSLVVGSIGSTIEERSLGEGGDLLRPTEGERKKKKRKSSHEEEEQDLGEEVSRLKVFQIREEEPYWEAIPVQKGRIGTVKVNVLVLVCFQQSTCAKTSLDLLGFLPEL